jgi:hypothetical protein
VNEPLSKRILELIYKDTDVRRMYKESLTNWILDTQPRSAPLDTATLLTYLAAFQPDLLSRLKINVHIKDDIARALQAVEQN